MTSAIPDERRARGPFRLRYEDVTRDGRVRLETLAAGLGVVWRERLAAHPLSLECRARGILPILVRFVLEGEPGPFGVEAPAEVRGAFSVAHGVDAAGQIDRLLLDVTSELWAPIGRTVLPPPADAGRIARVGGVRAVHVFTRPFARAEDRKVLDAALVGGDIGERVERAEPEALLVPPADARCLDDALVPDPAPVVFGETHSDSNQHVNSLVYPRLFEDAVLRRLALHGREPRVLARSLDVRYRKPSFVGDRLALVLRAYERGGRVGAVGAFVDGEPSRPRVTLRMELE